MEQEQHQGIFATRNGESPFLPNTSIVMSSDNHSNHARQLQIWLDLPTAREQRRFLEAHCNLLDQHSEAILHGLLVQEPADVAQVQHQRTVLLLLQDARRRGGTAEAVREAFINLHGGFVLDLPPWLEEVEQHLLELLNQNRPNETAEARVELLQEALWRAQKDVAYAPELLASLRQELADAWYRHSHTDRAQTLETVITFCEEVLHLYTAIQYPYQYAKTQSRLGNAYRQRIMGERRENLERAIACHQEALRIRTLDTFPFDYALTQNNLGIAYWDRSLGERRENLERAITCYQEALRIHTLDTFPFHYANAQNNLGIAYSNRVAGERRENLERAIACYQEALRIRTLDTFPFDYAGTQNNLGIAYRERIVGERRENLDENTHRSLDLERTVTYRHTKDEFDALITEIRAANDPGEFLSDSLAAPTILYAATYIGSGHTLVYLVATPWGGVAIAALGEQEASSARFAALDLPDLTEAFVNTLIETYLQDSTEKLLGGFALAQMGEGFERVCQQWEGETFQAKAQTLSTACHNTQQVSTLDDAAQAALACPPFAFLAEQALASLNSEDHHLLVATFDAFFLQYELTRCLEQLGTTVLSPVIAWLQEQGVTSLTLIPCGQLAAFPLTAILLPDGRSVGETLPASVAPSARSLIHTTSPRSPHAGITTLGDPHENLAWSEAEALALSTLARRAALPVEIHLKKQATRERLLAALGKRWLVNACCHGTFDAQDFLQSALLLAGKGRVTMADMLTHHADLRGLRLLLLSACQTAQLDLQGARDEVHSLAAAMLQAGAQAVVATQWAVDDKATCLLMVRFIQEWLPQMEYEPPAAALARAQAWLRRVTNQELAYWQSTLPTTSSRALPTIVSSEQGTTRSWQRIPVRGRSTRWKEDEAQLIVRYGAQREEPSAQPYADPYYWAGFQVIGW